MAALKVRRSYEIHKGDAGIVRAALHFSFGGHIDPDNGGIGMLEVLNHDTFVPGSLWPMHYHQDIEAVTYVVKGELQHADSLGNAGVVPAGGVQVMTLGRGAEHSEQNASNDRDLEVVQMWIVPRRFGLEPRVQQREYGLEDRLNRLLRIAGPEPGEGLEVEQDASIFVSHLEEGRTLVHDVPDGHGGYLYLLQGRLSVNDELLATGDAAYVRTPGRLDMAASVPSEVLLVDTVLWRSER